LEINSLEDPLAVDVRFYRFNDSTYPIPVRVSQGKQSYLNLNDLPAESQLQAVITKVNDPVHSLNMIQQVPLVLDTVLFSLWQASI
jgi:hypothetical protein